MKVFNVILLVLLLMNSSCAGDENQPIQEAPVVEVPIEDPNFSSIEVEIINWFNAQQLSNGLLGSLEGGQIISLYDNALAAMVFMLNSDYDKAEKVFDFFNQRIESELKSGLGGFSQFRDQQGIPNGHRWMGDNAWLLIALNNYKATTGTTTYDTLAEELRLWLTSLQDQDGGLWAGFGSDNLRLNYKVTEGNIDAFNAVGEYTSFHSQLLGFLEEDRWLKDDKNLVAWPTNPQFLYALDLHSWPYLMFDNYPVSALASAHRFINTKMAFNGKQITGYCFDEDKDTIWLEGTAQMALAFGQANMSFEKDFYLAEIEKALLQSQSIPNASGFAYTTNPGTAYGADPLWQEAHSKISISSGAWYIFARQGFNPFQVGQKNIPTTDMFWLF